MKHILAFLCIMIIVAIPVAAISALTTTEETADANLLTKIPQIPQKIKQIINGEQQLQKITTKFHQQMDKTIQYIQEHPWITTGAVAADVAIEYAPDGVIKITEYIDSIKYTVEFKRNDTELREDIYVNGELTTSIPYVAFEDRSEEENSKLMNKARAPAIKLYKQKHG